MTQSDVLARAAKALRDAHTGERAASGFTRARVMNTLHRQRRRRIVRWAVFSPLVSLLLVGSAWAQSTGSWPALWRTVTAVFGAAPEAPEPSSRGVRRPPGELGGRAHAPPEAAPPPEAPPAPLPSAPEPAAAPAPPSLGAPPARVPSSRRARSERSTTAAPAPPREPEPAEPAPPPEPDKPAAARELALFRAAHDLHFQGDRPRAAIAAYEAYLREYPRGRFVPEARYNGALDRIKLGEREAARRELEPFAEGRYGGYRQREARELLDALR